MYNFNRSEQYYMKKTTRQNKIDYFVDDKFATKYPNDKIYEVILIIFMYRLKNK